MKLHKLCFVLLFTLTGPLLALAAEPEPQARALIAELGLREADEPVSANPNWQPRKVVVTVPDYFALLASDLEQRMRAAAGDVELVFDTSGQWLPSPELMAGADAWIGVCLEQVFGRVGDRFLWLHNYFVGMDRCSGLAGEQVQGRLFTNGKRTSGPAIAEHTMAMLFSIARGLPAYHRAQAANSWDPELVQYVRFGELKGKTLLVAGLGGIGTEVAWRAHGLGMRVIATRNSSRSGPPFVEYVGLSDELLSLAGKADVVVNALPLTEETTGLFDKAFFEAMPKGGIFVSVGRGASTVTADLVAALDSGQLYGAGLDVTDPEPLPPDSPLWQKPNVIITPHIAAAGGDSIRRGATLAVENLRRYVAGEPLLNVVDMARGY